MAVALFGESILAKVIRDNEEDNEEFGSPEKILLHKNNED